MLNSVMGAFGTAAIAGYGIAARLEFLLIPLVFGLGVSMTALVGVNTGAGNFKRAERIGWTGGVSAALLTGAVGAILTIAPGLWMNLFTNDPATYATGATYLRIAGPAFLFQGLGLSLYFASQGAGTVLWPVIATILRFVVVAAAAMIGVRVFAWASTTSARASRSEWSSMASSRPHRCISAPGAAAMGAISRPCLENRDETGRWLPRIASLVRRAAPQRTNLR